MTVNNKQQQPEFTLISYHQLSANSATVAKSVRRFSKRNGNQYYSKSVISATYIFNPFAPISNNECREFLLPVNVYVTQAVKKLTAHRSGGPPPLPFESFIVIRGKNILPPVPAYFYQNRINGELCSWSLRNLLADMSSKLT